MSSRIVHTRISDKTLVLLMDLLTSKGVLANGLSMAAIVSKACTSMANSIEKKLELQYPVGFNFSSELDVRLGCMESLEDMFDLDSVANSVATLKDEVDPNIDPLKQSIAMRVKMLTDVEGGVDEGFKFLEPSAESIEDATREPEPLNLDNIKKMGIEQIKKISPKDRLLEQAENNYWMTVALEIVYGELAITEWGSKKAENLLSGVYSSILKSQPEGEKE